MIRTGCIGLLVFGVGLGALGCGADGAAGADAAIGDPPDGGAVGAADAGDRADARGRTNPADAAPTPDARPTADASPPDPVDVPTVRGGLIRFNGRVCSSDGWCWLQPSVQGNTLLGIHGRSDSAIWAVGDAGLAMYWDGFEWSGADVDSARTNKGVWSAGDQVWIAGDSVHYFNGTAWSSRRFTESAVAVYGTSATDVWVLANTFDRIDAHRWNGANWNQETVAINGGDAYSIWAAPLGQVWIAAESTQVFHRRGGNNWERHKLDPNSQIAGGNPQVRGSGVDNLWTTAHLQRMYRWVERAGNWTEVPGGNAGALWVCGANDVWASGFRSTAHYDGQQWQTVSDLSAAAGWCDAGSSPWLAGFDGIVRRWDGGEYAPVPAGEVMATASHDVQAMTVTASGRLIAVTDRGWALENDGSGWTESEIARGRELFAIWSYGDQAWAVGTNGAIVHYSGVSWRLLDEVPTRADLDFYSITGSSPEDIWALGRNGVFAHYDGRDWTEGIIGVTVSDLRGAWARTPDDLWAVGENGTVARRTGGTWSRTVIAGAYDLNSVFGFAADDVWAVGEFGAYHWDGARWVERGTFPSATSFNYVWGHASDDVWLLPGSLYEGGWFGSDGTIYHWNGTDMIAEHTGHSGPMVGIVDWGGRLTVAGIGGLLDRWPVVR